MAVLAIYKPMKGIISALATLQKRPSALVLRVGVLYGWQSI